MRSYAFGQELTYNLNIYNGLPSNHVYNILIDHYDYLWLATERGVFRYNGYELKGYNASNGLYDEDVWRLTEDKSGRIWLSSISDHLPYIHNNNLANTSIPSDVTVYPKTILDYAGGIEFISQPVNQSGTSLCVERNDTVLSFDLSAYRDPITLLDDHSALSISNDSVIKINFRLQNDDLLTNKSYLFTISGLSKSINKSQIAFVLGREIAFYQNGDSSLYVLNVAEKTLRTFSPDNKRLYFVSYLRRHLYGAADDGLYETDSSLQVIHKFDYPVIDDEQIKPGNYTFYASSGLWNNCWGTNSLGALLTFQNPTPFITSSIDLTNYTLVSDISDTASYWWDIKTRQLSILHKGSNAKCFHLGELGDITKVLAFNNDSAIVLTMSSVYWLRMSTGRLVNFYTPFESVLNIGIKPIDTSDTSASAGAYDGVFTGNRDFYFLSKTRGFCNYKSVGKTLFVKTVDAGRYAGIFYDKYRDLVWLCKGDYIAAYNNNKKLLEFRASTLQQFGLEHIENLLVDRFGNIFIKDYKRLLLFNPTHFIFRTLYNNCILEHAFICLKDEELTVTGRFGVITDQIYGPAHLAPYNLYPNTKAMNFKDVTDVWVSLPKIFINTDNGTKELVTKSEKKTIAKMQEYKFVLLYQNNLTDVKDGDTLQVQQSSSPLQFDIINPAGYGKVTYQYYIDGISGIRPSTGALSLPNLSPDHIYTLSLVANDAIWRSQVLHLRLYVVPFWWQRTSLRKWIWIAGILVFTLILAIIVYLTRRIVVHQHKRRSRQMELELKAIHAQINPHFIYNTLSAAIFFINRNMLTEATAHIYKFSNLLRAYIKSSRNKTVSISEEITNITNYIELQQTRFPGKFDYGISIDAAIGQNMKIPSLLLQPLVENAISHGLFHRKNEGHLQLTFKREKTNAISILISDNGIGRKKSKEINANSGKSSFGSKLVEELVQVFNAYEDMKITIAYDDKQPPDSGTDVHILITYL